MKCWVDSGVTRRVSRAGRQHVLPEELEQDEETNNDATEDVKTKAEQAQDKSQSPEVGL